MTPDVLDHLNRIGQAPSIEEAWALHVDRMASYGFDRLLYATTRFRTGNGLGDLRDALILTNHTSDYMDEFLNKGHYFNAPTVLWVAQNTGAISWRTTAEAIGRGELTPSQMKVVEFNMRHGIGAGYTISFQEASQRAGSGIGLSSSTLDQASVDALWDEKGTEIEVQNTMAHLRISTLPYNGRHKALTKRQIEVLEWVAEGKTLSDIATIIDRNVATVEKHLKLARETLNVETTAQAIVKASVQNQFFLLEGSQ